MIVGAIFLILAVASGATYYFTQNDIWAGITFVIFWAGAFTVLIKKFDGDPGN
jgi:predicted membrane channel-forming protein YqfA (hemolysin III family)